MAKKKRNIESIPLKITQEWGKLFPGIWKEIDDSRDFFAKRFSPWNPICLIPTEATTYVLLKRNSRLDATAGMALQVLYSWRKYKKVYAINEDLAELLMKSSEDMAVLSENVMKLPFPAIYIEFDGWLFDNQFIGAFINFDSPFEDVDMQIRSVELQISLVNKELKMKLLPLVIKEGVSIVDSFKRYFDLTTENDFMSQNRQKELMDDVRVASQIIQVVLYLCAANAEIAENPVQKKIYQKSTDNNKEKDVLREVEKFDVGVRIGKAIKLHKDECVKEKKELEELSKEYRKGTKKRPHVRRSHFHNYWVGTGDNKHLELRFLTPAYINFSANNEEESLDVVKHEIVE